MSAPTYRRVLPPKAERILREVLDRSGDTCRASVLGPSQERPHVNARALCMYRMRRELGLSYPAIGRFFHRHHTSVMAAVRKYEPRWTADQVIQIPDLSGEWAI